jgi:hypothetical protein
MKYAEEDPRADSAEHWVSRALLAFVFSLARGGHRVSRVPAAPGEFFAPPAPVASGGEHRTSRLDILLK